MYTAYPAHAHAIPLLSPNGRTRSGGIRLRPFLANLPRASLILLVVLRHVCREGVIGIG
jgi:hypothetical protein